MSYVNPSDYPKIGEADYYPNVGMAEAAAAAAAGVAAETERVAAYQADAGRFVAENGGAVVDGHAPVGETLPQQSD